VLVLTYGPDGHGREFKVEQSVSKYMYIYRPVSRLQVTALSCITTTTSSNGSNSNNTHMIRRTSTQQLQILPLLELRYCLIFLSILCTCLFLSPLCLLVQLAVTCLVSVSHSLCFCVRIIYCHTLSLCLFHFVSQSLFF